jgi:hypothetical protein
MGWTAGVRFLAGASDLSLLHSYQSGSEAHPALLSPVVKRPVREAVHSPTSNSEVKNCGFQALTAVVMKSSIFWNITPCSSFEEYVASIFRVEE